MKKTFINSYRAVCTGGIGRRVFLALLPLLLLVPACGDDSLSADQTIADIYGVKWRLKAFEIRVGDDFVRSDQVSDNQECTLTFHDEENAGGINVCNFYLLEYEAGGEKRMSVRKFTTATEVFCIDQSLEQRYADALRAAERYELNGSILRIFYEGNSRSLLFAKPST